MKTPYSQLTEAQKERRRATMRRYYQRHHAKIRAGERVKAAARSPEEIARLRARRKELDTARIDEIRVQQRQRRERNKERIATQKLESARRCVVHIREYARNWRTQHKIRLNDLQRQKRWQTKLRVIALYGGSCRCCAEHRPEFLTIDHVNGDGARERKQLGAGSGDKFYAKLLKLGVPQDAYRLLCFNCNCARGSFGYCPHEIEMDAAVDGAGI